MNNVDVQNILNHAKTLDMMSALSYLKSEFHKPDGLCFNCLDNLLVNYSDNPDKVTVESYLKEFIVCKMLSEHKCDVDEL